MKVSGFTFVRNAVDLDYPVAESIRSILPICDEFVVAAGDSTDGTTELLRSIHSPKIRIIETTWDHTLFTRGASNAQQTNLALNACTGDWAFYLQADEVVHEDDLQPLLERMRAYQRDTRIDGFLFEYLHFFADYNHYQQAHTWYGREVRIVRTGRSIQSWKSAQGFRRHGKKIYVVPAGARIFHYGWVRPPHHMTRKSHALAVVHLGEAIARERVPNLDAPYDYGRLHGRRRFLQTHPSTMQDRIAACDWTVKPSPTVLRHDRRSIRALSWIENQLLGFRIGEHRNYILLPP